jgi:hypothetical protein
MYDLKMQFFFLNKKNITKNTFYTIWFKIIFCLRNQAMPNVL